MKSKKFFAFLAISAIIGSVIYIYSALQTAKAYTFFAPINIFGEKIIEPLKQAIISGKNSVENKLKQVSSDLVNANAEKIKTNAFKAVKNGVNSGLDAIGKAMGVDEQKINQENNQSEGQEKNNCLKLPNNPEI